ncbi:MAG: VanZ family protein [Christensenellaceae bacterium]
MKKVVKITACISLALFLSLSVLIQIFSLQNNAVSGSITNSFSKKIISLLYGDQKTETDVPLIKVETIILSKSIEGTQKTAGTTTELITTVTPKNATEKLKYYSSDNNIATIDANGKIMFKSSGDVYFYATNAEGKIISNNVGFKVVSNDTDISDLDLTLFSIVAVDGSSLDSLNINELKTIKYLYDGKDLPLNDVSFKSADKETVTVYVAYDSNVFALKQGQTTVTMYVGDKPVCSKDITVTDKMLKKPTVTNLLIDGSDQNEFTLELGDIYDLDIRFADDDDLSTATYLRLKEGTDAVIKVNYADNMSKLKIKCTGLGKQTIELVSFCDKDNAVYEFTVNVLPKKSVILGLNAPKEIYVDKEYSIKLNATDPDSLYGWTISCQSPFATVTENGKIKFTNTGKYSITYTSDYYPDEVYTFTVVVKRENYLTTIRKGLGHAGLFALLAIFATVAFGLLVNSKLKSSLMIAGAGLFNAILSEIFQLPCFASGRSARLIDVVIDFSGYILGFITVSAIIIVAYLIIRRLRNRKT